MIGQVIGCHDRLPDGTKVLITNGERGEVVSSEIAPNGVVVHTLRITHRHAGRGYGGARWEPLAKPKVKTCNYSFIVPEEFPKF